MRNPARTQSLEKLAVDLPLYREVGQAIEAALHSRDPLVRAEARAFLGVQDLETILIAARGAH